MKKKSQILSISFIVACLAVVVLLQNRKKSPEENLQARSKVEKTSGESRSFHSANDRIVERERVRVSEDIHHHAEGCECSAHSSNTVSAEQAEAVEPASLLVDAAFMDRMLGIAEGAAVDFPLPSGKQARGTVSNIFSENGQVVSTQGLLQAPQKGYFFFLKQLNPSKDGKYVGVVWFDKGEIAHRIEVQGDGSSRLVQKYVGKVLCYDYPEEGEAALYKDGEVAAAPEFHPGEGTSPGYQNGVPRFQSLPGATAVIYLDFDGQEGPIQGWPQIANGAARSQLNAAQIKQTWQNVSADYAPFNVNVTTDLAIYLAAPENSRQRCLHSVNCPKSIGIALTGSFNWGGDVPCWSKPQNGNGARVMSHELGHTLKLHHDGRVFANGSKEEYYHGHGPANMKWAPIMGYPLGAKVIQWSKGEYPLPSNTSEDDLAIIAGNNNNVGYRSDDHGENFATASYLEILADGTASQGGIIEKREDFDSFRFTTTAAGSVTLTVSGAQQNSTLDILAEIVGSDGTVIASGNPDLELGPVTLTQNLAAGDYFLRVSGVGRSDVATGYTDYASLGYYKVSGTVPNSVPAGRFTVVENSANGTSVGTVTPNKAHGSNALTFAITSGNTPAALQINASTGEITVANGALIDFEANGTYYDKPSRFELFVSVTDTADASLNETVRVVVTVENVNEPPVMATTYGKYILEHTPVGTLIHTMASSDPDYQETLTYSITAGNDDGFFAIDNRGKITVVGDINITESSKDVKLTVELKDSGTPALSVTAIAGFTLIKTEDATKSVGSISETGYSNIPGGQVSNLETNAKFPHSPDSIHTLTSFRSVLGGGAFGGVVRGYIIPPVSGAYTFWVSADDSAKLWLSTDDNPSNVSLLAYTNAWTNRDQWDKFSSQKSAAKTLVAGKAYYVELRYKGGGGSDHASVAWQAPGLGRGVILGRFMAPYFINYTPFIKTPSPAWSVRKDVYNGYTVGTVELTDFNVADTFSQFTITGGNTNGVFAIDAATGVITVVNKAGLTAGTPLNLEVRATDSGTPALSATKTITINVTAAPSSPYAGRVYKEVWRGIQGDVTTDLTSNANYPDSPTEVLSYTSLDQGGSIGNQYGARIRAYVIPSVSGKYKFWIASNEQARLFMSPDEKPAGAVQIAWNPRWTISGSGVNQWIRDLNDQRSAERDLVANKKYYIEVVHKKGGAGNDLRVAWTGPGMGSPTIIGSPNLEIYDPNAQPKWSADSYAFTMNKSSANGTVVGTASAVDTDSTNLLYNILSGNDAGLFAINFKTGAITVKDQSALVVGTYSLQIGVQDDNLKQYYFFGESTITATIKVTDDSDNDLLADTWETAHFGNTTTYTSTSDPDGDGLDNFAEMAFASNPLVKDSTSSRTKAVALKEGSSEFMEYRYRRPKNHVALRLVYETKISLDLKDWVNATGYGFIQKSVESTPADSFEWVVYKIPIILSSKIFAKTEVKPAP